MTAGLKGEVLKEACAKLRALLMSGEDEDNIPTLMGLTPAQVSELRVVVTESEADAFRTRPDEHTYVQYVFAQTSNIKALDKMIGLFASTKQFNAMVGAVRAKAEILDKIVQKGQEFGLIKKKAERKEIVAGIMVTELSAEQLRERIMSETVGMGKLMSRYEELPMADLEMPAEEIHRLLPPPPKRKAVLPTPGEKPKAHSRSKVFGGRKITKTKA